MSANNELRINKKDGKWWIRNFDVDGCGAYFIHEKGFATLEEAVKAANEYMEENEVEYGLRIIS